MAPNTTGGEQEEMARDGVYHVVCRDCEYETVVSALDGAERATASHADDRDHTVVYSRID